MRQQPLRTVVEWRIVVNPDPGKRRAYPTVHVALFSCGHTANFGSGPRLSATALRCAQCPPVESHD